MSSSINPSAAGHHSKSYRRSAAEANGSAVGHRDLIQNSVGAGNGGNGGTASDDSMHEKYFKSVENTPLSRRRHTTTPHKGSSGAASASSGHGTGGSAGSNMKHSSDSSPQSPISPHGSSNSNKQKPLKISPNILTDRGLSGGIGGVPMLHSPGGHSTCSQPQASSSSHAHHKQDSSCSLELLNLERLSLRDGLTGSGGGGSIMGKTSPHLSDIVTNAPNTLTSRNFPSSDNIGMLTHSSRGSNDSRGKHKISPNATGSWSQQQHLQQLSQDNRTKRHHNSSSLDKHSPRQLPNDYHADQQHNNGSNNANNKRDSHKAKERQQHQRQQHKEQKRQQHYLQADNSDTEYDNGNISPLYSNWDTVCCWLGFF